MISGIPCRYCGRRATHQVGIVVDASPAGLTSIYVCGLHQRATVLVCELLASQAFHAFALDAVERRLILPETFEVTAYYYTLKDG